jgi:hypothetical protein
MPYQNRWVVPGQLALCTVWGEPTNAEVLAYDRELKTMLEQATHPRVHAIFDMRGLSTVPPFQGVPKIQHGNDDRFGWIVFVGVPNGLVKFFINVAGRFFHRRFRFFETTEDALHFLQQADEALPPLHAPDVMSRLYAQT